MLKDNPTALEKLTKEELTKKIPELEYEQHSYLIEEIELIKGSSPYKDELYNQLEALFERIDKRGKLEEKDIEELKFEYDCEYQFFKEMQGIKKIKRDIIKETLLHPCEENTDISPPHSPPKTFLGVLNRRNGFKPDKIAETVNNPKKWYINTLRENALSILRDKKYVIGSPLNPQTNKVDTNLEKKDMVGLYIP